MQRHVLGQYLCELDLRVRNKGHVAKVLQVNYLCYTRRHSNLKDERTPCEGHEGNSPVTIVHPNLLVLRSHICL